ncbi:MAG: transcription termination/antitermination protein NusG [Chakrabartia sp.]
MTEPKHWHVIKTQPQKETLACAHLERQGVASFFPRYTKTIRRGSRFVERSQALFPGYVFVAATDDPAIWRQISNTRGVAYLVKLGRAGEPARVPDEVMSEILAHFAEAGSVASNELAVGDAVEIERGPLAGLAARIISLDARGRVELLLELMGGVPVTLARDQLRAA